MRHIHWLRNTLRNKFNRTFIGKALVNLTTPDQQSICFVSATRLSEKDFWTKSLLGRSLRPRLNQSTITCRIAFDNTRGLPDIYNEAIQGIEADILVFLHDDVWLEDTQLMQKIRAALKWNDVIGVAGNIRRVAGQPAWLFLRGADGNLELDRPNLSGSIKHGEPGKSAPSHFGAAPAACELMDGVFLAAKRQGLLASNVGFDPAFKFDFYDMDFCRAARQAGLTLSTWPIDLIHLSSGLFGSASWQAMEKVYFAKWS
ncbi:glycosyltransferase [Aquabacterium sp. G14]|uniref:glycosyltransferase n=1 Tax=Aquabacterium sp. G14 TaxID=3130164 RepID=UPI0030966BCD